MLNMALGLVMMFAGIMTWLYTADDEFYKIIEYGIDWVAHWARSEKVPVSWLCHHTLRW